MVSGTIHGSLDDLMRAIARFKNPDLVPLSLDIQQAIVDGNREGLLAGTDMRGLEMAELKESTLKRGREGFGPPTIPRYAGSQLIDRFRVEVTGKASDGFTVRAGWDGVRQVRYFQTGTKHMVPRNPVGMRPATRQKIRDLVNAFARNLKVRL